MPKYGKAAALNLHRFCGTCFGKMVRPNVYKLLGGKRDYDKPSDVVYCSVKCYMHYRMGAGGGREFMSQLGKKTVAGFRASGHYERMSERQRGKQHPGLSKPGVHARAIEAAWQWAAANPREKSERIKANCRRGPNHPRWGKVPPRHASTYKVHSDRHGILFRSKWEMLLADELANAGIQFEYEGVTLSTPTGCFTPDFYLREKGIFVEVKGIGSAKQSAKMAWCIESNYPLVVVTRQKYKPIPDFSGIVSWIAKVNRGENRPKHWRDVQGLFGTGFFHDMGGPPDHRNETISASPPVPAA